jgi:hypothetical protein
LWRGGFGEGLRRQAAAGVCEVAGKKRTEDMVAEAAGREGAAQLAGVRQGRCGCGLGISLVAGRVGVWTGPMNFV